MLPIAAPDPISLVIYNPPHAKRVLSPEDYERIAESFDRVIGAKTGGGDDRWYELMLSDLGEALEVEKSIRGFIDTYIRPFVTEGGYGAPAVDKLLAAVRHESKNWDTMR